MVSFQYIESVATKECSGIFPRLFYLGTAWAYQCEYRRVFSIPQRTTVPYSTDFRNSSPNTGCSRQEVINTSQIHQEATGLGTAVLAATCQICSFLSTVLLLCSCLLASKRFPGTVLLSNLGPSEEEKVFFFHKKLQKLHVFNECGTVCRRLLLSWGNNISAESLKISSS